MIRSILITSILLNLIACAPSVRYSASGSGESERRPQSRSGQLEQFVRQWMGAPYLLGGMAKSGVDCSGFVSVLYESVYRIGLPRQAEDQYAAGTRVHESAMKAGDLVFFRNITGSGIDHVGVYLGGGRFAHASTSAGVTISELGEEYYRKRFAGARRYF